MNSITRTLVSFSAAAFASAAMAAGNGTVYAMTNDIAGNSVVAYTIGEHGGLSPLATYPTLGNGSGELKIPELVRTNGLDPLFSQGSIALSGDRHTLFVANAVSGTITSFRINEDGTLVLASVVASGGEFPNSITESRGTVAVTNVGDPALGKASNVALFRVAKDGGLTAVTNGVKSLSTPTAFPTRVLFSPTGKRIQVSELNTGHLDIFRIEGDGSLGNAVVSPSVGAAAFGSQFVREDLLVVANAGSGSVSTYAVGKDDRLTAISGNVPNGQIATCWITLSQDQKNVYASNTISGTVSWYSLTPQGQLTLVDPTIPAGGFNAGTVDAGFSQNGKYFYQRVGHPGVVLAYRYEKGKLVPIAGGAGYGLPAFGGDGLVVR